MKVIKFPEQNAVYAKNQPEYLQLPAHRCGDPTGRVIFCWKLTWKERFQLLWRGKIWHHVLTFDQALQPQLLCAEKPTGMV